MRLHKKVAGERVGRKCVCVCVRLWRGGGVARIDIKKEITSIIIQPGMTTIV